MPRMHPILCASRWHRALSDRLTELEAANAIREVIDRIVITPGQQRGENHVTLRGDLATILEWIERTGKPGYKPATDTASSRLSVSFKTRACPGRRTWMAGTSPAMTKFDN